MYVIFVVFICIVLIWIVFDFMKIKENINKMYLVLIEMNVIVIFMYLFIYMCK